MTLEENCFTAQGGRFAGRIWIDPATDDVLQLESRLAERFDFFSSEGQRDLPRRLVVRASTTVIRFQPVVFQNPDETVLLPASIESVAMLEGARMAGFGTTHRFTEYPRFVTEGRIR